MTFYRIYRTLINDIITYFEFPKFAQVLQAISFII